MVSGFGKKVTTYLTSNLPCPHCDPSLFASSHTSASYFPRANLPAQPNTKQDAGHCRPQAPDLPLLGVWPKVPQTWMLAEWKLATTPLGYRQSLKLPSANPQPQCISLPTTNLSLRTAKMFES